MTSLPNGFELPPFYCPIPSVIHPEVNVLEREAERWFDRIGLAEAPTERAWLLGTRSAEFYGRIAPDVDTERLQPAVNWCYWAFALDDALCEARPKTSGTRGFAETAIRLLAPFDAFGRFDDARDPRFAGLTDLVTQVRALSTDTQFRRWTQAHRSWLMGAAWETRVVESGDSMPVSDYLTMRLRACAGEATTTVLETVRGHEIPSMERDSPLVVALTESACLVAAIDNDFFSYRKETLVRKPNRNILTVVVDEHRCSLSDALVIATGIRDRVMSLFLCLREEALKRASEPLRDFVSDLGRTIRGNIEWSETVPRYNSVTNADGFPAEPVPNRVRWAESPSDTTTAPLNVPTIAWWWDQIS